MGPQDANIAGNVHGGAIMRLIDEAAGMVAHRYTRTNCVLASVDRIYFYNPVFVGDIVSCKASLNLVSRTSMEIGVRVEAENPITGSARHTASAYLTLVALTKDGRPMPVPPLSPETPEEIRRNREAQARKETRLREIKNK